MPTQWRPSEIITLEAANLFAGDEAPNASNHLSLLTVTLPALEEEYYEHMPGGAPRAIEVAMHQKMLECYFALAGFNRNLLPIMARQAANRNLMNFTIYGCLRNQLTRRAMELKAVMEGRLGQVVSEVFARGLPSRNAYSIRSIWAYQLSIDGQIMHDWNFLTNRLAETAVA